MPEGNELHRWANLHNEVFAGKKVQVDSPQGRFTDAPLLSGRTLVKATAVGKHLGYDFGVIEGERRILHIHMGLYGDFTEGKPPMPEPRGALRLRIWTRRDWLELRGPTDCSLWTEAQWQALLDRLGPDPLNRDKPAPMIERIAKRKTAIGLLLMDQSIVSGVGNIYRAELLFRARISPFRPGNEVPAAAAQGDVSGCGEADAGCDARSQDRDHEAEGPAAQARGGVERRGALCLSASRPFMFPLRHCDQDAGDGDAEPVLVPNLPG